jgi:hypothetical protein
MVRGNEVAFAKAINEGTPYVGELKTWGQLAYNFRQVEKEMKEEEAASKNKLS